MNKEEARLARQRALETELARRREAAQAKLRGKAETAPDGTAPRQKPVDDVPAPEPEGAGEEQSHLPEFGDPVGEVEGEADDRIRAVEPAAFPADSPAAAPDSGEIREETESGNLNLSDSIVEEAGDYTILISNTGMPASSIIDEFIRDTPAVQVIVLSCGDLGIYLSIKLVDEMPLVSRLSQLFYSCRTERKGRIIIIKGQDFL